MKLVSVFDYRDLPRDLQLVVRDGQLNDSFCQVYLGHGPTLYLKDWERLADWAIGHGAHKEEGDEHPYVLFSVSW